MPGSHLAGADVIVTLGDLVGLVEVVALVVERHRWAQDHLSPKHFHQRDLLNRDRLGHREDPLVTGMDRGT